MPFDGKLPDRILDTYVKCIESEEILYYPSKVTKESNELRTEIRLCESLASKPGPTPAQLRSAIKSAEEGQRENHGVEATELAKKLEEEERRRTQKKNDVFAPENWDSLLADQFDGGLGESYGVLLNKYAVVPLHFLLVTRHWEQQTAPLTPPQLTASYQLLSLFASTMPHATPLSASRAPSNPPGSATNPLVGGELLCFFNCGDASGASQEHKHLQFVPMTGEGSIGLFPFEQAAQSAGFSDSGQQNKPFSIDSLPYAHHIRRLDPPPCPDPETSTVHQLLPLMTYLQEAYLSLLDAMVDNLRLLHDSDPNTVPADKFKLGQGLSYNLLMTRKHMHIIPRRDAIFRLEVSAPRQSLSPRLPECRTNAVTEQSPASAKAALEPTFISCNSLAYTGSVLVKSIEEANKLETRGGVLEALKHCGYPKSTRQMPSIAHDVDDPQIFQEG